MVAFVCVYVSGTYYTLHGAACFMYHIMIFFRFLLDLDTHVFLIAE